MTSCVCYGRLGRRCDPSGCAKLLFACASRRAGGRELGITIRATVYQVIDYLTSEFR